MKTNDGKQAFAVLKVADLHEDFAILNKYKVLGRYKEGDRTRLAKMEPDDIVHVLGVCVGLNEATLESRVLIDDCDRLDQEVADKSVAWGSEARQKKRSQKIADESKAKVRREAEADRQRAEVAALATEEKRQQKHAADGMLRTAKKFADLGKKSAAKDWLAKLVNRYPDSDAAKEAGAMLKAMDK